MYKPINCKTHLSVLSTVNKCKDLEKLELDGVCLADINTVSGAVEFEEKKLGRIGMECVLENGQSILFYAVNLDGWKQLMKIHSLSKRTYSSISEFLEDDNLIKVYMYCETEPVKGSFFGIDLNADGIQVRKWAYSKNYPTVCAHPFYLSTEEQLQDLQLMLAIAGNCDLEVAEERHPEFFSDKKWHIMPEQELIELGYLKQELDETNKLYDRLEKFSITRNPITPEYDCPNNMSSNDYLKHLCRIGWRNKINNTGKDKSIYLDRFKEEFAVLEKYKLEDYFLILRDILQYTNKNYGFSGVRGSAGGCLISYLIDICTIDPMEYNLLFSRFLNEGRFTADRIQMPDIDADIPADSREHIIEYIKEKYGRDKVGQIRAYQTVKGSAALKAVFRANGVLSFEEVNRITKDIIPEDNKVSDKMKDMGTKSIIWYALNVFREDLMEWCHIDDNGNIAGEYGQYFEQAMRIEGTYRAKSRHAAGIVVSPVPLTDICPVATEDNEKVCDMNMGDLEAIGCLKLDLLAVRFFDKSVEITESLYLDVV